MSNTARLAYLIQEHPELPIVPMVDCKITANGRDGRRLGATGRCYAGEYALYNGRYYYNREELKEDYCSCNWEKLYLKFGYDPRLHFNISDSKNISEQSMADKYNSERLEAYLNEVADNYFTKAIILNIDLPR